MLTIRLSRIGKKKKPKYRLIISEKAKDPYGRALEILGSYDPFTKDLNAKAERIKYWLSKGSGMSPTVNNLLIDKGIIEGEKVSASKNRQKKKKGGEEAPAQTTDKPDQPEKKEEKSETEPKKEKPAEPEKKEEKSEEEKK